MTVRYTIQGNEVRREEYVESTAVPLGDFLGNLTSFQPFSLSPMPKNIQYISTTPSENQSEMTAKVIVQRDPHVARINFLDRDDEDPVNYRISLPYSFFWFVLRASQIYGKTESEIIWTPLHWGLFWSNGPFTGLDTKVTGARLPNCYPSGDICWGSTNVRANQPFGHFIDSAINTFFLSKFNQDIDFPWPYPSMYEWQSASEEDPEVWRKWGFWANMEHTIGEKLNAFADGEWRQAQQASVNDVPIPEIPMSPTFRMVDDWLNGIEKDQIERLRYAIERRND